MITTKRLKQRAAILRAARVFFEERDYLEVDTPVRLPTIVPEVYITPQKSTDHFLQTSPELCMKRLLAAGHVKLFQICRCFRSGERGRLHLPEFLMLEWYRVGINYQGLMDECEELVKSVILDCGSTPFFPSLAGNYDLGASWQRLTVAEAFAEYAGCSAEEALAANRYEEVLCDQVEPNLGLDNPVFLYDYPSSLASLARMKNGDPSIAERFELYIKGIELANGFSELVDPVEQRLRFEKDRKEIMADGRDPGPMPEKFLWEISAMEESAGIALGLDRLIMVLCGAASIDEVVPFVPEEL